MRKLSAFLLILFLLTIPVVIHADNIDSIEVVVELKDDGSASVYQIWDVENDSGTELYIPMQFLNHMELTDFGVALLDDDLKTTQIFTFEENWNVNASFDEKSLKCGINETNDGFELCWGKTNMGKQKYGIYFVYKNMIQSFSDFDGFNVRFINDKMNPAPKSVYVYLEKEDGTPLNEENTRIWSFGNTGSIDFKDGYVYAIDEEFNSNKHVTITMRFNKGLFTPSYEGNGTFEELREKAFNNSSYSNSDYYSEDNGETKPKGFLASIFAVFKTILKVILYLVNEFFGLIAFLVFSGGIVNYFKGHTKIKNRKEADRNNPPYYRDILLDCYLPAIYVLEMQDTKSRKLEENIISSYFLKWIKDGALTTEISDPVLREKMLKKRKTPTYLQIIGDIKSDSPNETFLWEHIVKAAGENMVLEEKELQKYFRKNYKSLSKLYSDFEKEGFEYLIDKGLVTKEKQFIVNKYNFTSEGLKVYSNHLAMHRFFKDFTLINEREPSEVVLWDYYLIIATLFGMGEEVSKSFKDLVPEYQFANNMSPIDSYYFANYMSHAYYRGFGSGRSSANTSSSRGFGGGASFGGGGGFSGGGSGGGSR